MGLGKKSGPGGGGGVDPGPRPGPEGDVPPEEDVGPGPGVEDTGPGVGEDAPGPGTELEEGKKKKAPRGDISRKELMSGLREAEERYLLTRALETNGTPYNAKGKDYLGRGFSSPRQEENLRQEFRYALAVASNADVQFIDKSLANSGAKGDFLSSAQIALIGVTDNLSMRQTVNTVRKANKKSKKGLYQKTLEAATAIAHRKPSTTGAVKKAIARTIKEHNDSPEADKRNRLILKASDDTVKDD